MHSLSLRARAVLGGFFWIVFAVGLSGYILLSAFDGIVQRSFDRNLSEQLDQMSALIATGAVGQEGFSTPLRDPRYLESGSGLYWMIEGPDGTLYKSPSLGDESLPLQPDAVREVVYAARSPEGFALQVHARPVEGPVQEEDQTAIWRVYSAEAIVRLSLDKLEFRRNLFGALIGLGASLILAGAAQTGMALRPLVGLRSAFVAYRTGEADRIDGQYPSDIEPLVSDLNELLDRNGQIIGRARRQAADLAHALKTPAAILRNEVEAMEAPPREMLDALDRIDTLMTRYTARARLAGAHAPGAKAEVAPLVDTLGRVMGLVHGGKDVDFDADVEFDLRVKAEEEDLEELLGNLIDNAYEWSRGHVRVTGRPTGHRRKPTDARIVVEDDGPGIPADKRSDVLHAGTRLDEATPGTGLGLAICSDILEAYGGKLEFDTSELGGLRAEVTLPLAQT